MGFHPTSPQFFSFKVITFVYLLLLIRGANFSENRGIKYAGRKPSASPATGNKYTHINEQKQLLAHVFNVNKNRL